MAEDPKHLNRVQAGFALGAEKRFYFNGFSMALSPMDFSIVLLHNDEPIAYLVTSYSIAKTMAGGITDLIAGFEQKTGSKVPTLDEIQDQLAKQESDAH